jgi:hypothetical protein
VFVRATAADTDLAPATGELSLDSARLAASYRWKDRMRVKLSLEAAGKVAVRDAFVALDAGGGARVSAGRFKLPITALERASAWTLPTIDRGAVAEVLEDGVGLTGRRDGVGVTWRPSGYAARLEVVASQSVATSGEDPARPLEDGAGVAAAVRGAVAVTPGVTVGAGASNREVNFVAGVGRYWAGALDLEVDLAARGLGLRVWGDLVVGQSHLGADTIDEATTFVAAQLVAGWRLGGADKGKRYVEPYVLGAILNPELGDGRDDLTDVTVGVAAGRWKRWRGHAQLSVVNVKAERPAGLAGFGADVDDRVAATVQLGAVF